MLGLADQGQVMLSTRILPWVLLRQVGGRECSEHLGDAGDLPGCLRVTARGMGQPDPLGGGFRDRVVTLWVVGKKIAGDVPCSVLQPGQNLFPPPFCTTLAICNLFPTDPCAKIINQEEQPSGSGTECVPRDPSSSPGCPSPTSSFFGCWLGEKAKSLYA